MNPAVAGEYLDGTRDAELARYDAQQMERDVIFAVLERNAELERQILELEQTLAATERARDLERGVLEREARTDVLTGLGNRRGFETFVDGELRRGNRSDHPTALIMIDVDRFKAINDLGGHEYGDRALQSLSAVLRASARREGELAARIGGEEFAIVLGGCDLATAISRARDLHEAVHELNFLRPDGLPLRVSMGVTSTERFAECDRAELLRVADVALLAAKDAGRDAIAFGDGFGAVMLDGPEVSLRDLVNGEPLVPASPAREGRVDAIERETEEDDIEAESGPFAADPLAGFDFGDVVDAAEAADAIPGVEAATLAKQEVHAASASVAPAPAGDAAPTVARRPVR